MNGTDNINCENISILFIDEILQTVKPYYSNNNKDVNLTKIIESFQLFPAKIYQHSIKSFISEPIHHIKGNITKSKKNRNDDPRNGYKYGKALYYSSMAHLEYLENLLSVSNIEYQIIADNLAEEILQCSIVFFNEMRDSNLVDPGKGAFSLAEIALNIVQGARVENRIIETTSVYTDWIDDKPERDKQKKNKQSIEYIQKQLDLLPDVESLESTKKRRLVSVAINLIDNCIPSLNAIRDTLGMRDELYLDISSEVAGNAVGMCIECANQTKEYDSVLNAMKKILKLDMTSELRQSLKKNIGIIEGNIKLREAEKAAEEKYEKIKYHSNYIKTQIENLPDPESLSNEILLNLPDITKELLDKCAESLRHIKTVAGALDEFYLNISSTVAGHALGMCIIFLNQTQKIGKVDMLIKQIGQLDMNHEARGNYIKNKTIFDQIKQSKPSKSVSDFLAELESGQSKKVSQVDKSGFCYIATMVYGDYNAPEVIELRKFRDNILAKYLLGRFFIAVYYRYSPFFVKKFNHSQPIKKTIKIFLQRLIKVVRI